MGSRAASTSRLYTLKWAIFERWCTEAGVDPLTCSIVPILNFLQSLLDGQRAPSTVKVYAAAISACHEGFTGVTVFTHPLVNRFLRGARRARPVARSVAPQWDLSLVLDALCDAPFEPIAQASLKLLSFKTALLLALTSAKRVGDLCALSTQPACLAINGDKSSAVLRPNPAFTPKVVTSSYKSRVITLDAFFLPPHLNVREERLHKLCPVRALAYYVERTASIRLSTQLLICYAGAAIGRPLSAQRLSHWLCDCITLAYKTTGQTPPTGLRAHSTRGIAVSTALFQGVRVQDICTAASWSSPSSFVESYLRDIPSASISQAVLSIAADRT